MTGIIYDLIKLISDPKIIRASVIPWASPVAFFGKLNQAKIATLGLNPSDLEFNSKEGRELSPVLNRLPTLRSLKKSKWETNEETINQILSSDLNYFNNRPYDFWFKKLDYLINGAGFSYYFPKENACHLDLVPFATTLKWKDLKSNDKATLITQTGGYLAKIINQSNIQTLVLNGQSVVSELERVTGLKLKMIEKPEWSTRNGKNGLITGKSYTGVVTKIRDVQLKNPINILGFNHNIQSSYGITKEIQSNIRNWISSQIKLIADVK